MNDLLTRQVGGKAAAAVAVGGRPGWCRFRSWSRWHSGRRRSQLLQQLLEEQQLLGIYSFGRPAIVPPEQLLKLMLQGLDGAGVGLALLKKLLALGAKQFVLLTKRRELSFLWGEGSCAFRGHIYSYA